MNSHQTMFNEINGILTFLSNEDRRKLSNNFIDYFNKKADVLPEKIINPNKKLKEQNLNKETILMLAYINKLLKNTN